MTEPAPETMEEQIARIDYNVQALIETINDVFDNAQHIPGIGGLIARKVFKTNDG